MVQILLNYAENHHIILSLNEKTKTGECSLTIVLLKNINVKLTQLLMEYAEHHKIHINFTEKRKEGQNPLNIAFTKNIIIIIQLLLDYAKRNITELD